MSLDPLATSAALPPIGLLGEALIDVFPDREVIGGAPFNVARNLAALGAAPRMVTRVGRDRRGDAIATEFERFGLDAGGLQRDPLHATGTVTVHMSGTHHRFEIHDDQAWDHLDARQAAQCLAEVRPAIVYFGTLAQRSPISRTAIREALAATDAVRFLDLNLRDGPDNRALAEASLTLADLVKVNDEELVQLLQWFGAPGAHAAAWDGAAWHVATGALMARFNVRRLVITRGAQGWTCLDAAAGALTGASPPVVVRDTVGAGDAFASVLLLGEASGWPLAVTLERAAGFAAQVCTLQGAAQAGDPLYARSRASWS